MALLLEPHLENTVIWDKIWMALLLGRHLQRIAGGTKS